MMVLYSSASLLRQLSLTSSLSSQQVLISPEHSAFSGYWQLRFRSLMGFANAIRRSPSDEDTLLEEPARLRSGEAFRLLLDCQSALFTWDLRFASRFA